MKMSLEDQMETLQLNEDTRIATEIEIDRARIEGMHQGIKEVIYQIEKIEENNMICAQMTCIDILRLKDALGILVYKNWPKRE